MAQLGVIQIPGPPELGPGNEELERYLSEITLILNERVMHRFNAATEVPGSPWQGLHGVTSYGPTGGDGLYIYLNGAWYKATLVADGNFPN